MEKFFNTAGPNQPDIHYTLLSSIATMVSAIGRVEDVYWKDPSGSQLACNEPQQAAKLPGRAPSKKDQRFFRLSTGRGLPPKVQFGSPGDECRGLLRVCANSL